MSAQAIADGVNMKHLYLDELKALKEAAYHAKEVMKLEQGSDEYVWQERLFTRAIHKAEAASEVLYEYDMNPYAKK